MTDIVIPDHIREAAARVRTRLPRETVERALALHELGRSRPEIAADTFINVGTFDRWRRQAEIEGRGSGCGGWERAPREYIERAIESYKRTQCMRETAEELGRHEGTILALLHRHAPDLIRPVGGPRIPVPDGWETADDYAARHGRPVSSVYNALKAGRVPGARRFSQPRASTKQRWLIPVGTQDVLRGKPVRPIDELAQRRALKAAKFVADVPLPARPLAEWIHDQNENGLNCDVLAREAGMTDGSRLRIILRGEQDTIGMATADRLLTANDAHLHDVWPHLDDMVALHAWAKEHRPPAPTDLQPHVQPATRLAVAA